MLGSTAKLVPEYTLGLRPSKDQWDSSLFISWSVEEVISLIGVTGTVQHIHHAAMGSTSISELWARIVLGYPPGLIELGVAILCQVVGFWLVSSIYLAIDLTFPDFSNRHKLQSERRQPSWASIRECIWHVLVGNLSSTAIHFSILWLQGFQRSFFTITTELPSLSEVASDFAVALVLREILFYTSHRALHHPKIYAQIHKQHHRFVAPMAFAAQYAHPVEHVLANTMPIVLPLMLMHAHILTFALFLTSQLVETASVHSGYDFAAARAHDLHHEKFRMNYGAIGLMDWLCGTNVEGWDKPKTSEDKMD
jgi:sterol desaturase/sphingolipid hydroxylase (fatty acid hydroxylase superfamily)